MEFRIIEEFPNYMVSEFGEVLHIKSGRFRKKQKSTNGYYHLNFNIPGKNKIITKKLHRLVALCFIGQPPEGKNLINHKDGNKLNNHYSNLEWVNELENSSHAAKLGLYGPPVKLFGEDSGVSKLTEVDVLNIRDIAKTNKVKDILKLYPNISETQIRRIIKKESWSHI